MIKSWEIFRARREARVRAERLARTLRRLANSLDYNATLILSDRVSVGWCVEPEVGKTRDYSEPLRIARGIKRQLRLLEVRVGNNPAYVTAMKHARRQTLDWLVALQHAEYVTTPFVRLRARQADLDLARVHDAVRAEISQGRPATESGPGRAARQLVALAVLVLPADQRARYAEEFRAELSELRLARVRYALRLIAHSWSLRRSLR